MSEGISAGTGKEWKKGLRVKILVVVGGKK